VEVTRTYTPSAGLVQLQSDMRRGAIDQLAEVPAQHEDRSGAPIMRALHTAATGMMAQELNVQVISNNIANMRTTGYKRQRAEFQDLLYEHVRRIGTQTSTQGNILPVGIDLGGGVKAVGTPRLMTQGTLTPTGADLNIAIRGEGFFK